MKQICILIIMILCSLNLYGEIATNISGNIEYSNINTETTYNNGDSKQYNINRLDTTVNVDTYFDSSKFVVSIGYLGTDSDVYNNVVQKDITPLKVLYINEFYYTTNISEHLTVSIGEFTFRKGTFYEHSYTGDKVGNGLYNIIDVNLQGGLVSCITENHVISIGRMYFDKYGKSFYDYGEVNPELSYDSYKGTNVDMLIHKYNKDELYIETNIYDMEQVVNGSPIINTKALGVGISYDNTDNSGILYYSILTKTKSTGDTTSLSPIFVPYKSDKIHFDKFRSNGYSYLLGVKKELDNVIYGKDMTIGFTYTDRSKGYHSLLAGSPMSPMSYSDVGKFYNVNTGLKLNKDTVINLMYSRHDTTGINNKLGLSTLTYETGNLPNGVSHNDSLIVQFYMNF